MKFWLHPSLFWIAIIFIIFFIVYSFLLYFKNKNHTYDDLITFITIAVGGIGISIFLLIFAFNLISIWIVGGVEENAIAVFTILNSFLFGMYMGILGFIPTSRGTWQRVLLTTMILGFILSGFGYLGIRVVFNYPLELLLVYNRIQTNSHDGGLFFVANIHIWFILYIATLTTESEVG